MKSIFISIVLLFSTSVFGNADIANLASQLGDIAASGMTEYDLKGDSLGELVYSYAEQAGSVEEDTEFNFNSKDVSETDEFVYGSTDAKVFFNLLFSGIYYMDEDSFDLYSQEKRQDIEDILKSLESTQVIYSWNPHGASVCGTFFTTPVLIDPKAKKAYGINFYKFEGC